ncbi:MAG: hypothetical protein QXS37_01305 [Candidatus Aenigmatarchaeota archaeon]
MRVFVVTTFIGCFGVDENRKILCFKPFPKDPEKVAEKIIRSKTDWIEEEREIQIELKGKGYDVVKSDFRSEVYQFIKQNLRELAIKYKFFNDQVEFNQFYSKVTTELVKNEMRKMVKKDIIVVQIIKTIEDLDKTTNILMERLREFYSLHFPEMDKIITDHKRFAWIVEKYGHRENIEDKDLKNLAKKSMGVDFGDDEIKVVESIASKLLILYELREELAKKLEKILKEVAPNLLDLAGPILSAKLIARAGSLEKLAKMASSAIQLIGAEKSLFRFLRGKGKSPRFGILYNHPLILNSPEKLKGKIARVLASKLSIAAKLDFYSKEYMGEKLKKELEEKIKKIRSCSGKSK